MLMPSRLQKPSSSLPRWIHSNSSNKQAQLAQRKREPAPSNFSYKPTGSVVMEKQDAKIAPVQKHRHQRNAFGVQLLSQSLYDQVFKNYTSPPPPAIYMNIARGHLEVHELNPSQSSILPSPEFTLPPLQGNNILEHFYRIGSSNAEPYLSLAKSFATAQLHPPPEHWNTQAGWTKYIYKSDGSGYHEHVPYPMHDGKPEEMLSFDIENLPKYHHFPVMACAASPNAWYAWISPWILDPSNASPEQLIPLGPPDVPRIVVGHNVSYDRARVLEEYHVNGTKTRFLDTMALHVAVKGISSHQRPAWMKHKKNKEEVKEQRREAVEVIRSMIQEVQCGLDELREAEAEGDVDEEGRVMLVARWKELQECLSGHQASMEQAQDTFIPGPPPRGDDVEDNVQTRWEDLTSMNSLADVAKLYCSIDLSKEIRNDFMTCTPEEILANISDYIGYCAGDVSVTHQVYTKVFPGFSKNCPHPVSFAGILTMGSGFLPVNQEWEAYLERAEGIWNKMSKGVKDGLENLAREAVQNNPVSAEGGEDKWKDDPWLSQLDWTPKVVGKSRGVFPPEVEAEPPIKPQPQVIPRWYSRLLADPLSTHVIERILPYLLNLSFKGHPMIFTTAEKWHYLKGKRKAVSRLPTASGYTASLLIPKHALKLLSEGQMGSCNDKLAMKLCRPEDKMKKEVLKLAKSVYSRGLTEEEISNDPWYSQLDWSEVTDPTAQAVSTMKPKRKPKSVKPPSVYWPKWFWDLTKPKKDMPPASLDITMKNRFAPLLLRMSWHNHPLYYSREYGWTFRVPPRPESAPVPENIKRLKALDFHDEADASLNNLKFEGYTFYKLPHKDGEAANVGSPLTKTFMNYAIEGTLSCGAGEAANAIVDVAVQSSYWISSRDRIMRQMVGWQDTKTKQWDMGLPVEQDPETCAEGERPKKWGLILPQVITMGTVTRRAIERTWLTASNAKKNRVGSELKAMVRAPPGYSIVGADVDSEELWISSCIGDAQFGVHGATAIGWMTLEGTKAAGTDLHSKTAAILGTSRNQAKVFNYSRIYGAGMRHAILLLQQGNPNMTPEEAHKLASNLYASTKGKNTYRTDFFGKKFWFGGTESFLFNKLEAIALSDLPQTPALGCGITQALCKTNLPQGFGSDYLPSRINWVVQSSGVDYLHLLIVAMDHLINKYGIQARYLISVHDELRYLVKEEDRYRAALALQIANLWTRSMFSCRLGMADLPQGVAFFSAVDVDKVLRKEVDMPCITPSQPEPIPPGECLDIVQILGKTNNGSLWPDGRAMETSFNGPFIGTLEGYVETDFNAHRSPSAEWLQAQSTKDFGEVRHLAKEESAKRHPGDVRSQSKKRGKPGGSINKNDDWAEMVERVLQSGRDLHLW
ncbi:gamma DNA-directed DNA polymerase [Desarmillaria tabescens]|uniref:Mitochondrial DNA polymerase catalytic subunit n=1 Tax=Armillaria tabescens TaxID=1929756 RepID=A0AA39NEN5_ARMTA|nr:gamma DNA-directed DNA polymerase [Desarmillaria tabescens]KAK0464257.1 gamma DNA-directed DNA polymerase [Desarmillaria tabescens]